MSSASSLEGHRFRQLRFSPSLRAWLVTAALAMLCCIWVYPLVWMVFSSLKPNNEIFANRGLWPDEVVFENYVRAWNDAHIGQYFINTVLVTAGSVLLVVISSAMMGYLIGRRSFPGRKLLLALLAFTLFMPQGYTMIPIFEMLTMLGISQSLVGLTLATSGTSLVIYVLLFAGYFSQLPDELEEASIMDGVGFFRTFWFVMLPLSRPITVTVVVMQTLHAWNDFLLPLVITLANPAIRTLSVGVYAFKGQNFVDWGGMMAASAITIVPVVVLFIVLQRYFINGLAGAVKG